MNNKINIILFVFLLFLLNYCKETENNKQKINTNYSGNSKIDFYKESYDFGTLKEGEIVECTFIFKNIGTAPLKIKSVEVDCGCTTPQYDKGFILPGKEGKIKVVFDSNGFRNNIYKTINVETNADSTIIELVITAFIESNLNLN